MSDIHFPSAEALADWLESLHEATPDGAVTPRKWEPAQRAAAAVRAWEPHEHDGWGGEPQGMEKAP
jgi:predicted RNA-binding protein associated with RNAse of E/G family